MKTKLRLLSFFLNTGILFMMLPGIPRTLPAENPLGLQECLQLALNRNRLIQVSDLAVQQATEKIFESEAMRWPGLSLNTTYTRLGKVTSFEIPMGGQVQKFSFGVPNRLIVDARAQMPLFTWGRIPSGIRLSRVGRELSLVERKNEITTITFQVLQAFYSVLLNERIIELHRQNSERADEFLKISRSRFAAGGLPRLELLRAEVQASNSLGTLEESRGNLTKSSLMLARLVGAENPEIRVKGSLQFRPVEPDIAVLIDQALNVRSDYLVIQLQQERARQQISLAASGNKPNLALFTGYNVQNGFDPTDPQRFVDVWNLGVQLSFPIFDGFATSHKTQQARIESQKIQLQKEEVADLISLQIRQAVTTLQQAAVKIRIQEESSRLAREALQVATDQYRQGVSSSLDVLSAQLTLAQSEMMYTQAMFNHIMAKVEISRAIEDFGWFAPDLALPEPINP